MAAGEVNVLAFGPGALSLGLIGDRATAAGLTVSFVGRRDGNRQIIADHLVSQRQYRIITPSTSRIVPVGNVFFVDQPASRNKLAAFIRDTDKLIICTAMRSGQITISPLLTKWLEERRNAHSGGFVALIPCENTVAPQMNALGQKLARSNSAYLPAMVDRICQRPVIADRGLVTVEAERDYEWVVQRPVIPARARRTWTDIETALGSMGVSLVPDIAVVQERKQLLMNGVQTCLALFAAWAGHVDLQTYLATEGGQRHLDALTAEYAADLAIRQEALQPRIIEAFRQSYRSRISQINDDPTRILSLLFASEGASAAAMLDALKKLQYSYENLRAARGREAAHETSIYEAIGLFTEIWRDLL